MEQVSILDGRYELAELLGRGGAADVFRATDLVLDRVVAVKVLRDWTAEGSERERFYEEARTLARLNHQNLTTILDAGVRGDRPYLVMELVDGSTLAECRARGPLGAGRVASIGLQVAEALAHAHGQGVVHRDVKPSNVLLARDGRALVTDFGIARLLSDTTHRTRAGTTIGSPAYLAPEQVRGEPVTTAADVYSLGLVLLEALTGRAAYSGPPTEAALARLTVPPTIPDELPAPWRDLIIAMTDLEPANRPASRDVAHSLRGMPASTDDAPTRTLVMTEPVADPPALPTDQQTHVLRTPTDWPDRALGATRRVLHRGAERLHQVTADLPASNSRQAQAVLLAVLAGLVVLMLVIAAATSGARQSREPRVPNGLPPTIEKPLTDLHDAINGDGQ